MCFFLLGAWLMEARTGREVGSRQRICPGWYLEHWLPGVWSSCAAKRKSATAKVHTTCFWPSVAFPVIQPPKYQGSEFNTWSQPKDREVMSGGEGSELESAARRGQIMEHTFTLKVYLSKNVVWIYARVLPPARTFSLPQRFVKTELKAYTSVHTWFPQQVNFSILLCISEETPAMLKQDPDQKLWAHYYVTIIGFFP